MTVARRAPAALLEATVVDVDARPVRLAREWAARPAVLVLLRHFGCLFCKEQASAFVAIGEAIGALGAGLVFVGPGSAQQARWFRDDFVPGWPVYADAERVTYRALDARRGFFTAVNPRTALFGLRALRRGYRQTGVRGDPVQQGAVCVVTPDGALAYRYVSAVAGDHPLPEAVLAALRGLRD